MYANDMGAKAVGGLAVAVPGEVKGLYEVRQKYGKLPWASLVEPAIQLATDGFPLQPYLASLVQSSKSAILADNGLKDVFAPNGVPLLAGDVYTRKKLAETLSAIAKEGSDAFNIGQIAKAEAMVDDVQAARGILTVEDLANYKVTITPPVFDLIYATIAFVHWYGKGEFSQAREDLATPRRILKVVQSRR